MLMNYKNIGFAILMILFTATPAFSADTYVFDPVHTHIGFSAKHFVLTTVRGDFREFSGSIMFDEMDVSKSSVEVIIKAASINTNHEKRDSDLKGEGFLEVDKYPEITFKSKKIEKKGDEYVAVGDLTIHGVTREVAIPFTLAGPITDPFGNRRFGVEAGLTINRQDYGVSFDKVMDNGGLIVSNEVNIVLAVEAVKAKEEGN